MHCTQRGGERVEPLPAVLGSRWGGRVAPMDNSRVHDWPRAGGNWREADSNSTQTRNYFTTYLFVYLMLALAAIYISACPVRLFSPSADVAGGFREEENESSLLPSGETARLREEQRSSWTAAGGGDACGRLPAVTLISSYESDL